MFGTGKLSRCCRGLRKELSDLNANLVRLTSVVRRLAGAPNPIGRMIATQIGVWDMGKEYEVLLPTSPPDDLESKDIVRGEARFVIDDPANEGSQVQHTVETTPGQEKIESLKIKDERKVSGTFLFVDNVGNISRNPVVMESFVVNDDTPPPDPVGGFGVTEKGNVPDDEALG